MNLGNIINFNNASNRKKIVAVIFIGVILLIIILISDPQPRPTSDITVSDNPTTPTLEYDATNTWNGIKPGTHKISEVENYFGTKIRDDFIGNGQTKYQYNYFGKGGHPIEVITDYTGTIDYMRVPQTETKVGSLDTYQENLGLTTADLELYKLGEPEGTKVYVYLEEGIAFEANQYVREIYAIRFFIPTGHDEFLRLYGTDLTSDVNEGSADF